MMRIGGRLELWNDYGSMAVSPLISMVQLRRERLQYEIMSGYRFFADLVVIVHLAYVAFVLLGMLAILVGLWLRWRWVRNFWFRTIHFTMVAIVAIQSLVGTLCPLTTLEKNLRLRAGQADYPGSFIGHWAHELLFIDAPEWAFTVSYCLFGLLVAATLLLAPPRWVSSRNRPS